MAIVPPPPPPSLVNLTALLLNRLDIT
jgi:hypothetical protein